MAIDIVLWPTTRTGPLVVSVILRNDVDSGNYLGCRLDQTEGTTMANCSTCGTKLGFARSGKCDSCIQDDQRREEQSENEMRIADQREYDDRVSSYVNHALGNIESVLAGDGVAYLYKSVHVGVDSLIDEVSAATGLDLLDLTMSGSAGWEVIGVIPRTYSGSQAYVAKNTALSTSFAGNSRLERVSLSGNVIGAYLLMRLPITKETRATHDEAIRTELEARVVERLGPRP